MMRVRGQKNGSEEVAALAFVVLVPTLWAIAMNFGGGETMPWWAIILLYLIISPPSFLAYKHYRKKYINPDTEAEAGNQSKEVCPSCINNYKEGLKNGRSLGWAIGIGVWLFLVASLVIGAKKNLSDFSVGLIGNITIVPALLIYVFTRGPLKDFSQRQKTTLIIRVIITIIITVVLSYLFSRFN